MESKRREQLVVVALELFAQYGFREIGIDTIIYEAEVAKRTLYRHFESKDDLIVEVLERHDAEWREWFFDEVENRAASPKDQLIALFDVLQDWFRSEDFNGCLFSQALAEFPEHDDPVHQAALQHKRNLRAWLRQRAKKAGAVSPNKTAKQLAVLIEGAIATARAEGSAAIARQAQTVATMVIRAARRR